MMVIYHREEGESMQHPMITEIEKSGYPNMIDQPEHNGIDYFGDGIFTGDSIVEDTDTGEIILLENLEDYLIEIRGFKFIRAE